MDGDQGALNKIEHGVEDALQGNLSGAGTELSAALNDIKASTEKALSGVGSDAAQLFSVGIKTFIADAATPLGQAVVTAVGTAIGSAAAGQSVTQISAAVLPTLETSVVADAKAAGQDAENVVLNTARVMLLGQTASTANPAVPVVSAAQPS